MLDARKQCGELVAARGKTLVYGPQFGENGVNVLFAHDGGTYPDGSPVMQEGIYIRLWDEEALGPWPTGADGFTPEQLRCKP
ncbi:MAG: hypothetical protein JSR61_02635 [Proteobacteria bacterium]|nr:hypothetical protein [Pseudomonadota bacterium]